MNANLKDKLPHSRVFIEDHLCPRQRIRAVYATARSHQNIKRHKPKHNKARPVQLCELSSSFGPTKSAQRPIHQLVEGVSESPYPSVSAAGFMRQVYQVQSPKSTQQYKALHAPKPHNQRRHKLEKLNQSIGRARVRPTQHGHKPRGGERNTEAEVQSATVETTLF